MCLSVRWGNQLNNLLARSVLPRAVAQLDLGLGCGFITRCVPADERQAGVPAMAGWILGSTGVLL